MDEELTPEQRFNAEEPEIIIPRDLINGVSKENIIKKLVALDYSLDKAEEMIRDTEELIDIVKNDPERIIEVNNKAKKAYALGLPIIAFSFVIFFILHKIVISVLAFAFGMAIILNGTSSQTSLKEIERLLNEKEMD